MGFCTVTALRVPALGILTRFQGSGPGSTTAISRGGGGTRKSGTGRDLGTNGGGRRDKVCGWKRARGGPGRGPEAGRGEGEGPSRNRGSNAVNWGGSRWSSSPNYQNWTCIRITWERFLGKASRGYYSIRISDGARNLKVICVSPHGILRHNQYLQAFYSHFTDSEHEAQS